MQQNSTMVQTRDKTASPGEMWYRYVAEWYGRDSSSEISGNDYNLHVCRKESGEMRTHF